MVMKFHERFVPHDAMASPTQWVGPVLCSAGTLLAYILCQVFLINLPDGPGVLPAWSQWIGYGAVSAVLGFTAGMTLVARSLWWWVLGALAVATYGCMLAALLVGGLSGMGGLGAQLYALTVVCAVMLVLLAWIVHSQHHTALFPIGFYVLLVLAALWIVLMFWYIVLGLSGGGGESSLESGGGTVSGNVTVTGTVSAPQAAITHINPVTPVSSSTSLAVLDLVESNRKNQWIPSVPFLNTRPATASVRKATLAFGNGIGDVVAYDFIGGTLVAATTLTASRIETDHVVTTSLTGAQFVSSSTFTDGVATLVGGSITGIVFLGVDTITDSVATLTGGSLTSALLVDSETLTDGTASLANGTFTTLGAIRGSSLNVTTVYTTNLQTTASLSAASIGSDLVVATTLTAETTEAETITSTTVTAESIETVGLISGTIESESSISETMECVSMSTLAVTDRIATLSNGFLTSLRFVSSSTITDTTLSLNAGSLTSAALVSASTLTDGTASLVAGSLANLASLSDGTATLTSGSLTSALLVDSETVTDGTASLQAGSLSNVARVTSTLVTGTTLTDGTASLTGERLVYRHLCSTLSLLLVCILHPSQFLLPVLRREVVVWLGSISGAHFRTTEHWWFRPFSTASSSSPRRL